MNIIIKLTVKELSKITGVSSRTLRYYDEIKLFVSSGSFENGYRYYTLDKIEEIRLITYLRHMGISIKEIKSHLDNRNIDDYDQILTKHLLKVKDDIEQLKRIKARIQNRISSLEQIRHLPPLGEISILAQPERRILEKRKDIHTQIDWELCLSQLEKEHHLPPSIIIGDLGFIVDLNTLNLRQADTFSGLFLLAEDSYYDQAKNTTTLPSGNWITLYVKGDHHVANHHYDFLLKYAQTHHLKLSSVAYERTIIDHFISSDPNLYITEIQILIM